ncbi:hypothetical protein [Rhizobium anhuiense]|jgi:hypothetical protein
MTAVSPRLPFEYYLLDRVAFEGDVACRLGGKLVPERVRDSDGRYYRFVGLARRDRAGRLDVRVLTPGEWIVAPDLVYVCETHDGAEDTARRQSG